MPNVELVYDSNCPNIQAARSQLLHAFAQANMEARWKEWNRTASDSPEYVRGYGSPTILVEGRDVAETPPSNGAACCRVYPDEQGNLKGMPPVEMIVSALLNSPEDASRGRGWRSTLSAVPAIGAALLPGLTCPGCFPAYAALLGSLGLGFINYTPFLFPITAFFLIIALVAFGYRARKSGRFGPLLIGAAGSVVLLVGKFGFASESVSLIGILLLLTASVWNLLLRRKSADTPCPSCTTTDKGGENYEQQA